MSKFLLSLLLATSWSLSASAWQLKPQEPEGQSIECPPEVTLKSSLDNSRLTVTAVGAYNTYVFATFNKINQGKACLEVTALAWVSSYICEESRFANSVYSYAECRSRLGVKCEPFSNRDYTVDLTVHPDEVIYDLHNNSFSGGAYHIICTYIP